MAKKAPVKQESDDESSDSDAPLGKPVAKVAPRASSSKVKPDPESESDDDAPLAKKKSSPVAKKPRASTSSAGKRAVSKAKSESPEDADEDDDDEEEEEDGGDDDDGEPTEKKGNVKHTGDGAQMWNTLYHTGPRFPPAYEPLPSSVKLKYDSEYRNRRRIVGGLNTNLYPLPLLSRRQACTPSSCG